MEALPGFIVAGIALVGSPGPATMSIAAAGAAFGRRHGFVYLLGINVGLIVVMMLTASGIAAALWAQPGAAPLVTLCAAAYFLWLAWRIANAPPLAEADAAQRQPPNFVAGIILSLLNPKAYASMAALFSGFILVAADPFLDAGLKIAILVAVVFLVDVAWLSVGAALTRHFRDRRRNRAINIGFAVLLMLSVAATLLI